MDDGGCCEGRWTDLSKKGSAALRYLGLPSRTARPRRIAPRSGPQRSPPSSQSTRSSSFWVSARTRHSHCRATPRSRMPPGQRHSKRPFVRSSRRPRTSRSWKTSSPSTGIRLLASQPSNPPSRRGVRYRTRIPQHRVIRQQRRLRPRQLVSRSSQRFRGSVRQSARRSLAATSCTTTKATSRCPMRNTCLESSLRRSNRY
jgi:hypothetical protein